MNRPSGVSPQLWDSMQRLAEETKTMKRESVFTKACGWKGCAGEKTYFSGDPRARGWLRYECSKCGEWGDADPTHPLNIAEIEKAKAGAA